MSPDIAGLLRIRAGTDEGNHHIEEEEKVLPALEQLPADRQLELGSNFALNVAELSRAARPT